MSSRAAEVGRWVRGVAVFAVGLGLGIGGLYLVAGDGIFRPETYRAENPSLSVAVLCVAAFVVEWFVADAARIWLLCRRQRIALPFRSAVLVHLVSMFAASVTPSNAGVGPTMALALGRLGVPAGRGVGVALQVFVLDAAFFAWAVPLSLGYLVLSGIFAFPVSAGVGALAVAVLALVAAVVLIRYPHLVTRIVLAAAQRPPLDRFAPRLRGFAGDYERGMEAFGRMGLRDWLGLQALTALGWFSGFALFWLLLELYGVDAGFLRTLAVLSGITLVSHLVPTPGASGFMEAALGLSVGAGQATGAAAAVLVWRLASYHVTFLLGPPAVWLLYLSGKVPNAEGIEDEAHVSDDRVLDGEHKAHRPDESGR